MSETWSSPLTAREVLERYFLEARGKLLEVAATLDRVDRAPQRDELAADARLVFLKQALEILASDQPQRAEKILTLYSLK